MSPELQVVAGVACVFVGVSPWFVVGATDCGRNVALGTLAWTALWCAPPLLRLWIAMVLA